MKRILCTGDSHTWGQGTAGLEKEFVPEWVGGELRLASFQSGCYVNRLRRLVNRATGSTACEWTAQELARMDGAVFETPWAMVGRDGISLQTEAELIRIELAMTSEGSYAVILVDGETVFTGSLQTENAHNAYRLITLHLSEGKHQLSILSAEGVVRVYRVEAYAGPCAVINSGIGSCPVQKFREVFFGDYAEAVRPDVVLMEAHTINDWLTGDTPNQYRSHLQGLIGDVRRLGAVPVVLTVAPIGGEQILPGLARRYDEFVEAGRQAVKASGARLCDANMLMKCAADGMSGQEMKLYLLADNWHVNDRGHAMYAQLLFDVLSNEEWFREMEAKQNENR